MLRWSSRIRLLPILFLSIPLAGLVLAVDKPLATPIEEQRNDSPDSLRCWHLYEDVDARAAVGDELKFVGRIGKGETETTLASPPWVTVTLPGKPNPVDGRVDTVQAFSFLCNPRPAALDDLGYGTFTGKIRINRPEIPFREKLNQQIPVFAIDLTAAEPIKFEVPPDQLLKDAATEVARAQAGLVALCEKHHLKYAFAPETLSPSWYQGCIAFTGAVTPNPVYTRTPVPYATVSVLFNPASGKPTRLIFIRRVRQDPRD